MEHFRWSFFCCERFLVQWILSIRIVWISEFADAFLHHIYICIWHFKPVADTFLGVNVSATCSFLRIKILFNLSIMLNFICNLLVFKDEDTSLHKNTSSACFFLYLRMRSVVKMHLHSLNFRPCRYIIDQCHNIRLLYSLKNQFFRTNKWFPCSLFHGLILKSA